MSKLDLFLLGSPKILVDGQLITAFNTRKDQALLVYLAVTDRRHSRETLAGLLWPELPEEKARRNLRHSLSHLQKAIGPQWLELERGVALIHEQAWSLDVHTLRSTVNSLTVGSRSEPGHHASQTLSQLDQVLQLYHGEFLQGFHVHEAAHFEEWVLAQREELRLLVLRGLEALVESCLVQGAFAQGLNATHRLLQLEPWSEPAHCLQMQLLAQSGRRAEALAQYERCCQILATELDVEPLPTTTALYQQIKSGEYHIPPIHLPPTMLAPSASKPFRFMEPVAIKTALPNNLRTPLAGFVGRQVELDLICQRLTAPTCRLLTIVGPGGIGKTSLAETVGQRLLQAGSSAFPDGLYFIGLAGLDPAQHGGQLGDLLATTIAERIGCDLQPGLPLQLQLQNYLHPRQFLLILDNLEHLLAATDVVLALLSHAPKLTMLITSRARLNLRGETVLTLHRLSLPSASPVTPADADWQTSEALAMFVQRAQYLDPHFTINAENLGPVVQICHLVDGLPLGIELATSMLPMVSCAELAKELAQSLTFLQAETHDLPADQRTLQAVFERSWRLLKPDEQALLAQLALWAGAFDWEAVQTIAAATRPLLLRLIHQSLVNTATDGRYALHPVVRTFALEKLEQMSDEHAVARIRYACFYLEFLAQKEPALARATLAPVIAQIYTELDNIRLAWRWAITYRLDAALLAAMHALFFFYDLQGLYSEAAEQAENSLQPLLGAETTLGAQNDSSLNLLIGRLQSYWGTFIIRSGQRAQAEHAFETSLGRLQHTTDRFAIVFCLGVWGSVCRGRDAQQSKALLSQAAQQMQTIEHGWLNTWVYFCLGEAHHLLGAYDEALTLYTKAYSVAEQTNCAWGLANTPRILSRLHNALGAYSSAEAYANQAIDYAQHQNMQPVCIQAGIYLGDALRLQGRYAEAQHWYAESRRAAEAIQHRFLIAEAIWGQGALAEQSGDYATAYDLFTESRAKGHPNLWAQLLPALGWALIGLGDWAGAYHYFAQVLTDEQIRQFPPVTLDAEVGLAYLAAHRSELGQPHLAEPGLPVEPVATVLQRVYGHPATAAETRQRIGKLASALGLAALAESLPTLRSGVAIIYTANSHKL